MRIARVVVAALVGFMLTQWVIAETRSEFYNRLAFQEPPSAPILAPEPEDDAPSDNFDPLEHLLPGEELIATNFANAYSISKMNDIRRARHSEYVQRWKVARGPLPVWTALMISSLLDRIMWFSGFVAAYGVLLAGAGGIFIGITSGSVGLSVAELVLQARQYSRPDEQTKTVLLVCLALFLAALCVDWLSKRYGQQVLRFVDVFTQGSRD